MINIIGSGFSSLASACYLAQAGFEVNVFEKNDQIGGRARLYETNGFKFDMGPSWYWMPDVFERFFADFGKHSSDYYELVRLSPAYRVFFEDFSHIDIPNSIEQIYEIFEKEEPGSSQHLKDFLREAEYNYEVAIKNLVYKPGLSPIELVTPQTVSNLTQFVTTIRQKVRKRFKNEKLIQILEFPVLFLGAKPQDTPAFYSFMNYADLILGTWYPKGGMYKIVEAFQTLAESLGVKIHTNASVEKILTKDGNAIGLLVNGEAHYSDIVLSGADYHHTESLLESQDRVYSEKYWDKRTFAPSALLFYVGFNKKLDGLTHHNLFFDKSFDVHAEEIYDRPRWPKAPLFYASFPSMTDSTVAPQGKENAFFLIPLAPDLQGDDEETREKYFGMIMDRLERHTGQLIREHIEFKRSYCVTDFKKDYHSYKGNAYGMANTLRQTAFLRPSIKSKKVNNLFFTGQLTVPGPGVPPALISGKIASELIIKTMTKNPKYDVAV
ncbi:MAG: phytoene desaturase [Bacteroidetes bacterium]|nr:MAG: phytoene desaturase [Bacteroidota bacterium]